MANERILLIEDDDELRTIIYDDLVNEEYKVKVAKDGEEGIAVAGEFQPELILLDLMLPKVDGFEVCRVVRNHSMAPIMILSAKSGDMDKMLSLGIGADDYMTKPFSMLELNARVKSHLRRYTAYKKKLEEAKQREQQQNQNLDQNQNLNLNLNQNRNNRNNNLNNNLNDNLNAYGRQIGDVYIDSSAYVVRVKGEVVALTTREFRLLDFLSCHPSQVFSKEQLLDHVWGESEFVDTNTITVYIGRIREKMTKAGACYIKTVWGAGYKWEI